MKEVDSCIISAIIGGVIVVVGWFASEYLSYLRETKLAKFKSQEDVVEEALEILDALRASPQLSNDCSYIRKIQKMNRKILYTCEWNIRVVWSGIIQDIGRRNEAVVELTKKMNTEMDALLHKTLEDGQEITPTQNEEREAAQQVERLHEKELSEISITNAVVERYVRELCGANKNGCSWLLKMATKGFVYSMRCRFCS